jgi:hypothetical protein
MMLAPEVFPVQESVDNSFFDNQLIMGFVAAISKITLGHIVIVLVFFFFF